jgi:Ni/Fe-hydrogenase subunit HybB-like protein
MLPAEKTFSSLSPEIRGGWIFIFALLAVIGAAAFLYGVSGDLAVRAWQAYLANFVFWAGLSFGAVLFSAILNMAYAEWGRPVKRLAEAFGAYLPVSYLLFWVLYFGRETLFHWIREPVPEKQAWLNVPFLFARNGMALLLLTGLCLALVYYSLRGDRQWLAQREPGAGSLASDDGSGSWRRQKILSPIIGFAYAFILTLVAFDLIMSLDPHWRSTLFGAYYFMGSFYTALAAIYLVSMLFGNSPGLRDYIQARQKHDLGKLTLAFSVFTGYLFYAQFNTIWYGNLPEETRYVILRVKLSPWEPLAWVALFLILIIPFFVLLNRKVKLKRSPMIGLTVLILIGMWLERFILVAPSIWHEDWIPVGLLEILITAGFLGLVALSFTLFLRRVPPVPISDPIFRKTLESGADANKLRP